MIQRNELIPAQLDEPSGEDRLHKVLSEEFRKLTPSRQYVIGASEGRFRVKIRYALARLIEEDESRKDVDAYERLTPRQKEVLVFLVNGRTIREIAISLGLSIKTVESHRKEILARLEVEGIMQLTRLAIRLELITP